jgi:two-component system response regulator YesN
MRYMQMHKILLVDDEISIINGLKAIICWENYNFSIAGSALNGMEALSSAISLNVDLVIMDIRMPGLTGLELLKKLDERNYKGKIIILSGYGEFDYAKEAIKWGVYGYLLKPIDTEELLDLLVKMDTEFKNEQKHLYITKNSSTILRDRSLRKLMLKGVNPPDLLLNGRNYCVCLLSFCDYLYISSEEGVTEADILKASILRILKEKIEEYRYGYAIELDNSLLGILLIENRDNRFKIDEIIQSVSKTVYNSMPFPCSMAIGSREENSSRIHNSYLNALKVINYKFSADKGKILHYNDFTWLNKTNFLLYKWDFQTLIKAVKKDDPSQIELSIDRFIQNISSKSWPLEVVHSHMVLFLIELADLFDTAGGNVYDIFNIELILKETYSNKSLLYLKKLLQEKCGEVSTWYKENIISNKSEKVIKKIIAFIETNYNQNINLKTISYEFEMNPVYLGRLFRKYTGKSFTDYINGYRIQSVIDLLENTEFSVTEICKMAGYNNINYFYQKFKKKYNITPLEYRRNFN